MATFDPERCDLCGAAEATRLAMPSAHSLRSDQVTLLRPLVKRVCSRCGLTREGASVPMLDAMYADEYAIAPADYVFYSANGPRKRSEVFASWFVDAFGDSAWMPTKRVLEIGAGAGAVMAALGERFPGNRYEGIELCRSSAEAARAAGHAVRAVDVRDWTGGPYDIIYAIAVLEHVPSPTAFLSRLRDLLAPDGRLFLTQPTQDVASYDVLFTDHLHHFGGDHLRAYARKTGFHERGAVVGHELMPNFSLHCWLATAAPRNWDWTGHPGASTVAKSFADLTKSFARFDEQLEIWMNANFALGVFGLNEVYALARAYTSLAAATIRCGLDDDPAKAKYRSLGFPVVAPEDAARIGIDAVVIAANKVWLPRIEPRLRRLGLATCPVLS